MERLLHGVVDFAGTFPPARLSPADSVARYLRARAGGENWILGRYVCATGQLGELADVLARLTPDTALPVCAVGAVAFDRPSWEANLSADAEAMNAFQGRVGDSAEIQAYEVRVPEAADIGACARDLRGFGDAEVFVELPLNDSIEESMARLADSEELGAKVRTGGLEVAAFPSARSLSRFLRACVELEMPFKLTAGLHHPLPRYNSSIGINMQGFVNLLTATALALSEDLSRREMERVLLDTDPTAWSFDDRGMAWRDFHVDLAGIQETRELFVAFGSCSIDDPLNGLAELFGAPDGSARRGT